MFIFALKAILEGVGFLKPTNSLTETQLNMSFVILLCYFICPSTMALLSIGAKEVHVEKLQQCPQANTSIVLNDVLLNYHKNMMTVNAQFNFKESIGGKIEMVVDLTKCQLKGEDTCEFNSRHKVLIECRQIHAQNMMWSEFVQHIQDLPDKCPITAGTYNMTDAPYSLSNMERLPLHVGYWKITANGFQKKKLVFCVVAEVDIQMKSKRRSG